MLRQPNTPLDAQKSITLKLGEPVVDADEPWADDLLARQSIAIRLTNLVATQQPPLAVSLHGQWGTGKTFMLRRWQKTLELKKYRAIYFNAWEDDFCDDPLLAILGQMSEYFKEGELKTLVDRVIETAIPLLQKNVLSVLSKHAGITLDIEQGQQAKRNLLNEYRDQRATKDKLKERLAIVSAEVLRKTDHPLVFIIDELDRCRPTFAIELLERVKHIFDVPNLVFVFGVNRDELCKSLSSVYGEIDTDVYLRRFFDFEFNLSEADSQGFTAQLIDKFRFFDVFEQFASATGSRDHKFDYDNFRNLLPKLWSALNLSLRDIDYGIRLIALLLRNISPGNLTHPDLVAVLIAMKFKNAALYRLLATGNFRTSEIMDYIEGAVRQDSMERNMSSDLDYIEGLLYCADNANLERRDPGEIALAELKRARQGDSENPLNSFQVISQRARDLDQYRSAQISRAIEVGRNQGITRNAFGDLAELIDTYQTQLRR